MTKKTTRAYCRQSIRPEERDRVEDALRIFGQTIRNLRWWPQIGKATVGKATAEFTLTNRHNPNGFIIRLDAHGKPKVERFINMGWARQHGYVE
jgi:hypothetical protein